MVSACFHVVGLLDGLHLNQGLIYVSELSEVLVEWHLLTLLRL